MPELPEVETIRRQLKDVLIGKVLCEIEVVNEKSFEGDKDLLIGMEVVGVRRRGKALVVDLSNLKSKNLKEKNKNPNIKNEKQNIEIEDVIQFDLSTLSEVKISPLMGEIGSESVSLVVHLKMTGQLIYEEDDSNQSRLSPKEDVAGTLSNSPLLVGRNQTRIGGGHPTEDFVQKLPSKHTRVIIKFKKKKVKSEKENMNLDLGLMNNPDLFTSRLMRGSPLIRESALSGVLYFNDQRKFGWIKMMRTEDVEKLDFVSKLGPEPWDINDEDFYNGLQKSKKPIKVRIMDQEFVAGVGNIYANDALWEAKIDPNRKANSLSKDESCLLLDKIKVVLEEGIYYGGATASDKKYMDLSGIGGKYQNYFRVYEREGEACKRAMCEGKIKKTKLGGRGTYWCDKCQK